ncbi:conserved protein, unknown function [Plasmodium knowlesi strain H]|uniref:Uncharacterized protein n=3 Tax=Plasmodium knowlesi TaxID=5850 RepID=A0A5K1UQ07_PLAKH|nr:conserved protein, unknown function [Plasmodium knowlesi strain H]OTN65561.1 Uncharacterized protein PKNOH_S110095800 [Plasmodium knowlesi]CAA9989577.1 conserved protein, unknown function [Plasmodium knowlesi strain H]SBO22624.1 conserved protein, unknown function [Plasmodium knowlesi strain H]SBO23439.1 conserved protein, unknown function [Plasmodium knowlesi strain H]VVS79051.1 conserved protein, unknown function [Plasmodium knowlesi strain H]|eukprot:XP_002260302.1 hypothetical protein, conserved in Plasmodium species [Plasmodium knowlesi strain H]
MLCANFMYRLCISFILFLIIPNGRIKCFTLKKISPLCTKTRYLQAHHKNMKFLLNNLLRKMPKSVVKETAKNITENLPSYIKKKDENFLINLRVKPNAKNTSIYFNSDREVLNINIQEQPINNQSNIAIIGYFSDILDLKKRDISIVSGLKSRDKVLMVSNISLDDLNSKIAENVE